MQLHEELAINIRNRNNFYYTLSTIKLRFEIEYNNYYNPINSNKSNKSNKLWNM